MKTTFFLKSNSNDTHGYIYFLFSTGYGKIKISTGEKIKKKDWALGLPKKAETSLLLMSYKQKINNKLNFNNVLSSSFNRFIFLLASLNKYLLSNKSI